MLAIELTGRRKRGRLTRGDGCCKRGYGGG